MSLRVSGKNLDVGKSLRHHIKTKVETLIARYFDGQVSGHVVISHEGSAFRADCSLHLSSGMDLQSQGRAHEPYASFDNAADKIERRLSRYSGRLKDHDHRRFTPEKDAIEIANFIIETPEDTQEDVSADYAPAVVAEGAKPLQVLSVAEAVIQLDLTGLPFLCFSMRSANG